MIEQTNKHGPLADVIKSLRNFSLYEHEGKLSHKCPGYGSITEPEFKICHECGQDLEKSNPDQIHYLIRISEDAPSLVNDE